MSGSLYADAQEVIQLSMTTKKNIFIPIANAQGHATQGRAAQHKPDTWPSQCLTKQCHFREWHQTRFFPFKFCTPTYDPVSPSPGWNLHIRDFESNPVPKHPSNEDLDLWCNVLQTSFNWGQSGCFLCKDTEEGETRPQDTGKAAAPPPVAATSWG